MKMRNLAHPDVIVDLDGTFPFKGWEIIKDAPLDRWRDVTGECVIADNGDVRHGDLIFLAEFRGRYSYRLRKVQVRKATDEVIAGMPHQSMQWAFLVERKEP